MKDRKDTKGNQLYRWRMRVERKTVILVVVIAKEKGT